MEEDYRGLTGVPVLFRRTVYLVRQWDSRMFNASRGMHKHSSNREFFR